MFVDFTINILYAFEWLVQESLQMLNNILTMSLSDFAPGAYYLSRQVSNALTGIGLGILMLLWLIDILSTAVSLKAKNYEEVLKLFVMFIFGVGIVGSSFFLVTELFRFFQWAMQIVSNVGNTALDGAMDFTEFITNTQDFVRSLRRMDERMIMFLFVAMFFISTVGAMLSIIFVPVSIFIQLYLYSAFSPIPLSTLTTSQKQVGISFLKTYAGIVLQGALVLFGLLLAQGFLTTDILSFANIPLEGIMRMLGPMIALMINIMVLQKCIKGAENFARVLTGG